MSATDRLSRVGSEKVPKTWTSGFISSRGRSDTERGGSQQVEAAKQIPHRRHYIQHL